MLRAIGFLFGLLGLCGAASAAPPVPEGAVSNFVVAKEPAPVPEVAFVDGEGRELSLADFEGQVLLVNFWATWCGPCRREMKDLDELQARLGGEAFQVLAISSDREGLPAVEKFYQDNGLQHLGLYNDKTVQTQRAFEVKGLPTTVLVDARGREVGRLLGPADWASPEAEALVRAFME